MARIGYARVSSVGQSLAVQIDKLTSCDKIYEEKKSGATGQRPRLGDCLEYVRDGDTLVVTRLDRLTRSTLHLCQIAAELQRKGVALQVLDQQLIPPPPPDGCSSTCWERSRNSRPRSAPSDSAMASRTPKRGAWPLAATRR